MAFLGNGDHRGRDRRNHCHRSHHLHRRPVLTNSGAPSRSEAEATAGPVWSGTGGGQIPQEVKQLVEQAHVAISEGRVHEAERLFQKASEYEPNPTIINNLALLKLVRHDQPDEALRLLNRNLEKPHWPWQPYTKALTARCYGRLERPVAPRRSLDQAIHDFQAGLSALAGAAACEREAWREYTATIFEAAGELGDNRLVWDLYQRWAHHHVLASSFFYGGIAAFNLKRFRSARVAWCRAREKGRGFLRAYETVAAWCERGLVEPFPLDYDYSGPDAMALAALLAHVVGDVGTTSGHPLVGNQHKAGAYPMTGNHRVEDERGLDRHDPHGFFFRLAQYISRPANRMFMIWSTFRSLISSDFPRKRSVADLAGVQCLMAAGGDWGEAWASRLFLSADIELGVKEAAALGLVRAGRLRPDGSVRMWVDGEVREVPLRAEQLHVAQGHPE